MLQLRYYADKNNAIESCDISPPDSGRRFCTGSGSFAGTTLLFCVPHLPFTL
jgi:hypothetical protein